MSYSKKLINSAIKKIGNEHFPGSVRKLSALSGVPRSSLMNITSGRNQELAYDNVLKITAIFGLTDKDVTDFINDSTTITAQTVNSKKKKSAKKKV